MKDQNPFRLHIYRYIRYKQYFYKISNELPLYKVLVIGEQQQID